MRFHVVVQTGAERMRRLGLAPASDVVLLAFNGQKGRTGNLAAIDQTAIVHHGAVRQRVLDEHRFDGLQIEFGRQVHDGEIFVIEVAVFFGVVAVAFHQMLEEVPMRGHVTVEVHAHEPGKLQEARINVPHETRMREGNLHDDVVLEPVDTLGNRQVVDRRRRHAGVDRPPHQRHRGGYIGVFAVFHDSDGCQHRHRRLTHAQNVRVRPEEVQHRDDIIDIIIKIELAFLHGNHAGIDPVGDVDIRIRHQCFHRAAQQRGVMAGHRRDDQDLRIVAVRRDPAFEVDQVAERTAPDADFTYRNAHTAYGGFLETELRLAVAARRAFKHLAAGSDRTAVAGMSQRIQRVLEVEPGHVGQSSEGRHRGVVQFVKVVKRQRRLSFAEPIGAGPIGIVRKHFFRPVSSYTIYCIATG